MPPRIYFDNAATTPLDPRVLEAMQPYLRRVLGQPLEPALRKGGRPARPSRRRGSQVADLLGAEPSEIVFTASGTEADNLAIRGVLLAAGARRLPRRSPAPSSIRPCWPAAGDLERLGVDADAVAGRWRRHRRSGRSASGRLRPETRLVSIMAANNVIGTLQPIAELAAIARRHGALFHTDAVQAVGKIPLDVRTQPIDLLSLSAHKLHGPKGVGALYVRNGVELDAARCTAAARRADAARARRTWPASSAWAAPPKSPAPEMADEAARLVRIRDFLIDSITATIANAYLIGHRYRRLPGHICLGFAGMEGEAIKLLLELDEAGIAISSGSACSANHAGQPSHVLAGHGLRSDQGPRLAADHARAVQHAGRGRAVRGSAAGSRAFAAADARHGDRRSDAWRADVADGLRVRIAIDGLSDCITTRRRNDNRNDSWLPRTSNCPDSIAACAAIARATSSAANWPSSPESIRRCIHLSENSVRPDVAKPAAASAVAASAAACRRRRARRPAADARRAAPASATASRTPEQAAVARQPRPRVRFLPGAFSRRARPARDHHSRTIR